MKFFGGQLQRPDETSVAMLRCRYATLVILLGLPPSPEGGLAVSLKERWLFSFPTVINLTPFFTIAITNDILKKGKALNNKHIIPVKQYLIKEQQLLT